MLFCFAIMHGKILSACIFIISIDIICVTGAVEYMQILSLWDV